MRPDRRADEVVRRRDVGHPVADRLVDRILERAAASGDRTYLRAEQPHAEDVERLAAHVLLAHIDDALQAELGADRRRRHAMLPRAGLGDDAPLAHARGEQPLPERVVDLVRAGVGEVFALEVDARANAPREPFGEIQRRGTPRVRALLLGQKRRKRDVRARRRIRALKLIQRGHQAFGDEAPAELAVTPARVRIDAMLVGALRVNLLGHAPTCSLLFLLLDCAAAMKRATLSRSFALSVSTPLEISTPRG